MGTSCMEGAKRSKLSGRRTEPWRTRRGLLIHLGERLTWRLGLSSRSQTRETPRVVTHPGLRDVRGCLRDVQERLDERAGEEHRCAPAERGERIEWVDGLVVRVVRVVRVHALPPCQ